MNPLVALSGYARSGKDTAAAALVEVLGYRRVAFADALKEVAYRANPLVRVPRRWSFLPPRHVRLAELVDVVGWDEAKKVPDVREFLQRLGTQAGRGVLGENVWVRGALDTIAPGERVVVTDCRFPNEATAVTARGGLVIRVTRPGTGPSNAHPSETSLDDYPFDVEIRNDGTVADLRRKILDATQSVGVSQPAT